MNGQRWVLRGRWVLVTAGVALLAVLGLALAGRPKDAPAPPVQKAAPWDPFVPSPAVSVLPAPSTPAPAATSLATSTSAAPVRTSSSPKAAVLSVSVASVPAAVDLAAEGTRDWLHWGLTSADGLDRKAGGTGEIQDVDGTGKRGRYDNNPELFSWTGGAPTAAAGRTPTGVYSCGVGSTFTLRVPAGPGLRTLHFYAGVWMAQGRLTLGLAGQTADAVLENPEAIRTARFTIRFRAPAADTLRITWTATKVYHPTCGNIDMQAATLS
ncbi:hypothetical protein [Actinoplanes sp. NPDC026619]|uniref:hypothetical protein n=1 Tax=Actinoplanes sp. NPDC026619 TaxID=3155798 RepID=UPI0033C2C13B